MPDEGEEKSGGAFQAAISAMEGITTFGQMFGGPIAPADCPPPSLSGGYRNNYNAIKVPVLMPTMPPDGFKADKMSEFLMSHCYGGYNSSRGDCAVFVRQAMAAGGLKGFDVDHPEYGGQYDPYMKTERFKSIASGSGAKFDGGRPPEFQVGDVVVIRAPGQPGHIAALCSDGVWHSDFAQNGQSGMFGGPALMSPGTSFTVYRHESLMGASTTLVNAENQTQAPPAATAPPAAPATGQNPAPRRDAFPVPTFHDMR